MATPLSTLTDPTDDQRRLTVVRHSTILDRRTEPSIATTAGLKTELLAGRVTITGCVVTLTDEGIRIEPLLPGA